MPKKFFDIVPPKKIKSIPEKLDIKRKTRYPEVSRRKPKRIFLKSLIFCLVFLILLGIAGFYIFSKVEIEIWPETDILNLKAVVIIDSELEQPDLIETGIIPGKIFTDQKSTSEEFSASGEMLKEEKANGIIRVYNNYHLLQTLVANTRFQPPLEKFQPSLEKNESPWFRTLARITIAPKSYKEVKVIADSPGGKYNITSSKFSIPGLKGLPQYALVYGESFQEFKGGFKDRVAQVTQEDLDNAENSLAEKLKKESKDFLKKTLPADFILLDETVSQEILESNSSVQALAEAESFEVQVKVKLDGIGFKKSDIENFAKDFISLNIAEGKKIQEESLKINYSPELIDVESGKLVLNLEIKTKVYSDIDLAELKKALLGKSLKETKVFLGNLIQVTKVEIKSWPFLKKKIPENMERIKIKLKVDPSP